MADDIPIGFFELRRKLDEAGVFHRVGSIRDETVMVEVPLPTSFWEIEFFADGRAEYEVFRSTGAILDAAGFVDLVVQWSEQKLEADGLERPLSELAVMRLLRAADIYFSADELLVRRVMVEGAVMIEAVVPGKHWQIDVLASGEIEVERFRSADVATFEAAALGELFASAGQAAPNRRKGLRSKRDPD